MSDDDDDEIDEETKKELQKLESSTQLSKLLEIPIGAKATIQIAIDRENAKARIKIIQADLIIKHGLLHKKKKGEQ